MKYLDVSAEKVAVLGCHADILGILFERTEYLVKAHLRLDFGSSCALLEAGRNS